MNNKMPYGDGLCDDCPHRKYGPFPDLDRLRAVQLADECAEAAMREARAKNKENETMNDKMTIDELITEIEVRFAKNAKGTDRFYNLGLSHAIEVIRSNRTEIEAGMWYYLSEMSMRTLARRCRLSYTRIQNIIRTEGHNGTD